MAKAFTLFVDDQVELPIEIDQFRFIPFAPVKGLYRIRDTRSHAFYHSCIGSAFFYRSRFHELLVLLQA